MVETEEVNKNRNDFAAKCIVYYVFISACTSIPVFGFHVFNKAGKLKNLVYTLHSDIFFSPVLVLILNWHRSL